MQYLDTNSAQLCEGRSHRIKPHTLYCNITTIKTRERLSLVTSFCSKNEGNDQKVQWEDYFSSDSFSSGGYCDWKKDSEFCLPVTSQNLKTAVPGIEQGWQETPRTKLATNLYSQSLYPIT